MKFSFQHKRKPSLDTLPSDVITQIALDTVCAPDAPSIRELRTLRSLQLTCGLLYHTLSLNGNPNLYGNIFKRMFDVDPVRRRLGQAAVVSSVLSVELVERISALQRIKLFLDGEGSIGGSEKITSSDWIRMFLMMTEDEGKNRHHLVNFVGISRILELFFFSPLEGSLSTNLAQDPLLGLFLALGWLSSYENLACEDPDRRADLLDFLQPFVLGKSTRSGGSSVHSHALESVHTIDYFGRRFKLHVPPTTTFSRLCTVALYNTAKKRTQRAELCAPEKTFNSGARFDNDWSRYITFEPNDALSANVMVGSTAGHVKASSTVEGLWEGAWFLPCRVDPTSDTIMCTRPMQFTLREYVAVCPDVSMGVIAGDAGVNDEPSIYAWFPEGVVFDETSTSLRVYDPVSERWLDYKPHSDVLNSSNFVTDHPAVTDTILVGNTEASHGARYGDYKFYGRVRGNDRNIALVRRPADPRMDDLGTWVFQGQIHGERDIVGDWRVTSADSDTPSGKGWFHLSKVVIGSELG